MMQSVYTNVIISITCILRISKESIIPILTVFIKCKSQDLLQFQLCYTVLSCFSCVWLFVTPWTTACQASLSMEFSRQEHWSGLSFPTAGDLPNLGIETVSPVSPALAGRLFATEPPGKPFGRISYVKCWHSSRLSNQRCSFYNFSYLCPEVVQGSGELPSSPQGTQSMHYMFQLVPCSFLFVYVSVVSFVLP